MVLKEKFKDQYVSYRNILKEKNLVEEIKQNVSGNKEAEQTLVSKENTRKWHSKLY